MLPGIEFTIRNHNDDAVIVVPSDVHQTHENHLHLWNKRID
jgi:hypothetical protein